jgi:hypothetical protein
MRDPDHMRYPLPFTLLADPDDRNTHTFEFSVKILTETHMAEVTIEGGDLAADTFFQRGPNAWHNIMGMPLHPSLVDAVELLLAEAARADHS